MNIKQLISINRKKKGLTQEQLANKINVSSKTVSNWERGITYPDITLIPQVCKVLEISLEEFFNVDKLNKKEKEDINIINKFKKNLIVNIMLLYLPFLSFIGTLLNNYTLFTMILTIAILGVIFSISTTILNIINLNSYINNQNYSINLINIVKNYTLNYLLNLFFIIIITTLIFDSSNKFLLIYNLIIFLIFAFLPCYFIKKYNLNYQLKKNLKYIIELILVK